MEGDRPSQILADQWKDILCPLNSYSPFRFLASSHGPALYSKTFVNLTNKFFCKSRVFVVKMSKNQIHTHSFISYFVAVPILYRYLPKRISKRGSMLKVRGRYYNSRFKLYR